MVRTNLKGRSGIESKSFSPKVHRVVDRGHFNFPNSLNVEFLLSKNMKLGEIECEHFI